MQIPLLCFLSGRSSCCMSCLRGGLCGDVFGSTHSARVGCVILTTFTSLFSLILIIRSLDAPSMSGLSVWTGPCLVIRSSDSLVLVPGLVLGTSGWWVFGMPRVLQDGDLQVVVCRLWSTSCCLESSAPSCPPYGVGLNRPCTEWVMFVLHLPLLSSMSEPFASCAVCFNSCCSASASNGC